MSLELEQNPKQNVWRKRLLITATVFSVLFASVIGGAFWFLQRPHPTVKGEVSLPILATDVSVYRDANGVPHIEAETEKDLYIAQGFVTAQDRLFQMDLSRRQASGRLSEVIGDALLEKDKYFLTLGLRRAAEASYNDYSQEVKERLQWYADGVNAFRKQALENKALPIEFTFLGYTPEEWTPVDSLVIGKYMAFDLGGNWNEQAFRHYALSEFPREKALEIFPSYPENAPTIVKDDEGNVKQYQKQASALPEEFYVSSANVDDLGQAMIPNPMNGSNNWVVSGSKSESGKPILSDDPHLGLATPSVWYETHLKTKDLDVQGVIFAGVPGIMLGHNEHVAWGVTNVGPDVQDLYIEKRNPNNTNEFLYNDKWEKATVHTYDIKIKGKESEKYDVVETRHGPVVSEFLTNKNSDEVLSLKWTALQPSTELEAIFKMNKATNWKEFKTGTSFFHTPAQNFVFASTDGTIAYHTNGLIPIRKKGNGLVPVPGWTDEYEWEGFIPWDELPTVVNPEKGFISTANNKVVGDQYPYHLSHSWAQPYRQMRIEQVLESKEKLTPEDMMKLQTDTINLRAEALIPLLTKAINTTNDREQALIEELQNWDFNETTDSREALVFQMLIKNLHLLTWSEIPENMLKLFRNRENALDELIRRGAQGEDVQWFKHEGGFESIVTKAWGNALEDIESRFGKDEAKWAWGDFHKVRFSHPLSSVQPLNYLFNYSKDEPVGGSKTTVMAAGFNNETGEMNHGAPWRFVADLSNLTTTYHTVAPGQSGHVLSEHYHDQKASWAVNQYHTTTTDMSVIRKEENKLILKSE